MTYNEQVIRAAVPLKLLNFSAGTWTYTIASNKHSQNKSAADTTTIISIPIDLPRRTDMYGVQLTKITVPALVTTADLDAAPSLALYRQEFDLVDATASATSAVNATSVAVTAGSGVVATADADPRKWEWTVTSPTPDYSSEELAHYIAELTVNAAAGSVVAIYTPIIEYKMIA